MFKRKSKGEKKKEEVKLPPTKGERLTFLVKYPKITEKAIDLQKYNQYLFIVKKIANKPQIKKEIERIYNVKISKVRIINQKGKVKRFRFTEGKRPDFKKAIVSLEKGYTIEITH